MCSRDPETLEDILADISDISITEVEQALTVAESVENLEDLETNLDDAEGALKEALKELRSLKKRVTKAIAQAAGRRTTNDEDEDEE